MPYIKLLDAPLKCPRCGVTRVALGMGPTPSLRSHLDGERPAVTCDDRCPDCGDRMRVDRQLEVFQGKHGPSGH